MRFVIGNRNVRRGAEARPLRVLEGRRPTFCVDNLPISLIEKFSELYTQGNTEVTKVALGHRYPEWQGLRRAGGRVGGADRGWRKLRDSVPGRFR